MTATHTTPFPMIAEDYAARIREGDAAERFGVVDSKGREVGGMVSLTTVTYATTLSHTTELNADPAIRANQLKNNEKNAARWAERNAKEGERVVFCYEPHATRDGTRFGASHARKEFKTEAARAAAVAKYFAGARKRAEKNAAKLAAKTSAPAVKAAKIAAPVAETAAELAARVAAAAATEAKTVELIAEVDRLEALGQEAPAELREELVELLRRPC